MVTVSFEELAQLLFHSGFVTKPCAAVYVQYQALSLIFMPAILLHRHVDLLIEVRLILTLLSILARMLLCPTESEIFKLCIQRM